MIAIADPIETIETVKIAIEKETVQAVPVDHLEVAVRLLVVDLEVRALAPVLQDLDQEIRRKLTEGVDVQIHEADRTEEGEIETIQEKMIARKMTKRRKNLKLKNLLTRRKRIPSPLKKRPKV